MWVVSVTSVPVKCFWIEDTGRARIGIRRYRSSEADPGPDCPREGGKWKYHGAITFIGEGPIRKVADPKDGWLHYERPDFEYPDHDDPRWPAACECGYVFTAEDAWQNWDDVIYRRTDTGEEFPLRDAPAGAMWNAWWMPEGFARGPDGMHLNVKCPGGGDWQIDGRASNCTLPDDSVHRCWIRHGQPPEITVDKDGVTCAAGAGSIVAGDYHGFIRDGSFTPG